MFGIFYFSRLMDTVAYSSNFNKKDVPLVHILDLANFQ